MFKMELKLVTLNPKMGQIHLNLLQRESKKDTLTMLSFSKHQSDYNCLFPAYYNQVAL